MTVVIPMAGLGTRLRPHTWSKPKPLVSVAGKAVLGHVLDMFGALPAEQLELVFIVGYLGEQVTAYLDEHYPHLKAHFVEQKERKGQSHALYLARDYLEGPVLMIFVDTIMEADFGFLQNPPDEGIAWVKPVEDPRRFGVVVTDENGYVQRIIEKPDDDRYNLAVVGCYYFPEGRDLAAAVEEQIHHDIQTKGEYYLADAINIMLQKGLKMRTQEVGTWLDAGTPEALLATNRYLLENGRDNTAEALRPGITLVPPVYIHPEATVEASVIGPYVSIGKGCRVSHAVLRDTILDDDAEVEHIALETSLIGRHAQVHGRPFHLNLGDNTQITL
ncbi:MAG: NTP transferase domain-containing protein [Chloroflexi bacterium]|nr:NTP transferase domain-containing protein [Chloroflexota bacterium]